MLTTLAQRLVLSFWREFKPACSEVLLLGRKGVPHSYVHINLLNCHPDRQTARLPPSTATTEAAKRCCSRHSVDGAHTTAVVAASCSCMRLLHMRLLQLQATPPW